MTPLPRAGGLAAGESCFQLNVNNLGELAPPALAIEGLVKLTRATTAPKTARRLMRFIVQYASLYRNLYSLSDRSGEASSLHPGGNPKWSSLPNGASLLRAINGPGRVIDHV